MIRLIFLTAFIYLASVFPLESQVTSTDAEGTRGISTFQNEEYYDVSPIVKSKNAKRPKNIVLCIGDGMGTTQIFAGMTANKGNLFLACFEQIGFSKTQSSDKYTTDSAAGGTAMATGKKTYNGAVGVDSSKKPITNIMENARLNGLSTGVVVTTDVTDATPAAFVAHVPSRTMSEEVASQYLNSGIEVFIGAGISHFLNRKDGRNLISELIAKGYKVCDTISTIVDTKSGKIAGFIPERSAGQRGDQLAKSTVTAINVLKQNSKGFFLMVEGSKIDDGGHAHDIKYVVDEMLDFDRTIGKVLEFAAKNRETLVVVVADHETGGLTLTDGDMKSGKVTANFSTWGHTGVMVPVFAYGPGSELFTGIYENTSLYDKFITALRLTKR